MLEADTDAYAVLGGGMVVCNALVYSYVCYIIHHAQTLRLIRYAYMAAIRRRCSRSTQDRWGQRNTCKSKTVKVE